MDIALAVTELKLRRKFEFFTSVSSTNQYLKDNPDCDVAIALTQTEGRGRFGRKFESDKGGLYFSFRSNPKDYKLATIAAAVAVCVTLENRYGLKPEIKWVNDILLDGKKLCGILAEGSLPDSLIIGIGINIRNEFTGNLVNTATRLRDYIPEKIAIGPLIHDIIISFESMMKVKPERLIAAYKSRIMHFGIPIYVNEADRMYTVTAYDVDLDGNLVVKDKTGETYHLSSAQVFIRL